MERLTENHGEAFKPFNYVLKDKSDVAPGSFGKYECFYGHQMAVQRLGYYEDLEEQGLLLKLPCAVGQNVYEVYRFLDEGALEIDVHKIRLEDLEKIGETVFLTRAEAEEALREMNETEG